MDLAPLRCYHTAHHLPNFSRHSTAFYIQHLWTSHASGAELETQLELGRRAKFISDDNADILIADVTEVARMINGLVRSLERTTRY